MEIIEKRLVDDVLHAAGDGTKADDGTVERVTFSYGGKYYEIDLNQSHRADFEAYLARWTAHARTVSPQRAGGRGGNHREATDAEIREWALKAGLENVPDRGRVRKELRDAYDKAH
nr:Lsr2 family protein [Rhodococcus sp. (in: high G+C Gram-positive bacteria)]